MIPDILRGIIFVSKRLIQVRVPMQQRVTRQYCEWLWWRWCDCPLFPSSHFSTSAIHVPSPPIPPVTTLEWKLLAKICHTYILRRFTFNNHWRNYPITWYLQHIFFCLASFEQFFFPLFPFFNSLQAKQSQLLCKGLPLSSQVWKVFGSLVILLIQAYILVSALCLLIWIFRVGIEVLWLVRKAFSIGQEKRLVSRKEGRRMRSEMWRDWFLLLF